MFKAVTGEDFIPAERKFKDEFTFKPYARFLYSCNDLPKNYGDRSEAFYRRLIIIRFSKPVPPEKRDRHLLDKFTMEADGILSWAIAGLKRVIANDYQFSETDRTRSETKMYKIQNNNVLAFVDENCVIEVGAESLRKDMYSAYKEFCAEASLGRTVADRTFNKEICKIDPSKIIMADQSITRRKIFKGIRMLDA